MKRNQSTALLRLLSSSLRLSFAFGVVGVFASVGSAASTSRDTYYVNDHLATTVATSDAAGEIAQIESDAFGTQTGAVAKDSRFTGKPYDADMGAYVFPFRNYRSDEARWMSADPSGFPDGINGIAYMAVPGLSFDATGLTVYHGTEISSSRAFATGSVWHLENYAVTSSVTSSGGTTVWAISYQWERAGIGSYTPTGGGSSVPFTGTLYKTGTLGVANGPDTLYVIPGADALGGDSIGTKGIADLVGTLFGSAIDSTPTTDLGNLALANLLNPSDVAAVIRGMGRTVPSSASGASWKNITFAE